ncbi:unnamed protein product [Fusarium graminearum]|nr:unnamed protein product [Fusarium graminearum]CAG1960119.1 unnamed protein product [Fusarium graminearum]
MWDRVSHGHLKAAQTDLVMMLDTMIDRDLRTKDPASGTTTVSGLSGKLAAILVCYNQCATKGQKIRSGTALPQVQISRFDGHVE